MMTKKSNYAQNMWNLFVRSHVIAVAHFIFVRDVQAKGQFADDLHKLLIKLVVIWNTQEKYLTPSTEQFHNWTIALVD